MAASFSPSSPSPSFCFVMPGWRDPRSVQRLRHHRLPGLSWVRKLAMTMASHAAHPVVSRVPTQKRSLLRRLRDREALIHPRRWLGCGTQRLSASFPPGTNRGCSRVTSLTGCWPIPSDAGRRPRWCGRLAPDLSPRHDQVPSPDRLQRSASSCYCLSSSLTRALPRSSTSQASTRRVIGGFIRPTARS